MRIYEVKPSFQENTALSVCCSLYQFVSLIAKVLILQLFLVIVRNLQGKSIPNLHIWLEEGKWSWLGLANGHQLETLVHIWRGQKACRFENSAVKLHTLACGLEYACLTCACHPIIDTDWQTQTQFPVPAQIKPMHLLQKKSMTWHTWKLSKYQVFDRWLVQESKQTMKQNIILCLNFCMQSTLVDLAKT